MALKKICNRSFLKLIGKQRTFCTSSIASRSQCLSNRRNLFINHYQSNRRFCNSANDEKSQQIEHIQSDSSVDTSQVNLSDFSAKELENIKKVAATIPQDGEERLLLSWICANCGTRCAKYCRKQSYLKTLVIMRCDDCRKWQLMSDHLHWFKDDAFRIEQLLEQSEQNSDPQIKEKIIDIINTVVERESEKSEKSE